MSFSWDEFHTCARKFKDDRGWGDEKFADWARVSVQTVRNWHREKNRPNNRVLYQLYDGPPPCIVLACGGREYHPSDYVGVVLSGHPAPREYAPGYVSGIIKYVKAQLGMTTEDIARWVGVSVAAVQSWECGRNKPPHNHTARLAIMFEGGPPVVIRLIQEKHNWSLSALATHVGSPQGAVKAWLSGRGAPSCQASLRIQETFARLAEPKGKGITIKALSTAIGRREDWVEGVVPELAVQGFIIQKNKSARIDPRAIEYLRFRVGQGSRPKNYRPIGGVRWSYGGIEQQLMGKGVDPSGNWVVEPYLRDIDTRAVYKWTGAPVPSTAHYIKY